VDRKKGFIAGMTSVALVVGVTPLMTCVGFLVGSRALLPVLSAAPGYAAMYACLRRGRRAAAVGLMLLWAAALGASATGAAYFWPARAAAVTLNGSSYWEEMRGWVETGQGTESEPAKFVPQHALHAALFAGLSLVTGSVVSIVFGAALMNYMAYYVARVAASSTAHPLLAALAGWHPWSVIRIASFVVIGVILAEPCLSRMQGARRPIGKSRRWLALAGAGLLVDVVLKTLAAPYWPALLRSLR
jgi:hypothetical protein